MLGFQEKRKLRKALYSKPVLGILLILSIFLLKATWGVYDKKIESQGNLSRVLNDLEEMEGRESHLKAEIERLSTQKGVEEEIRDKFRVVKEGEQVAVILEGENDASKEEADEEQNSFWKKIIGWFSF